MMRDISDILAEPKGTSIEKNIKRINIQISKGDYEKYLDLAFQRRKDRINIPGFRKGAAPNRKLVEARLGKDYFTDLADKICMESNLERIARECGEYLYTISKESFKVCKEDTEYRLECDIHYHRGFHKLKGVINDYVNQNEGSHVSLGQEKATVTFLSATQMNKRARVFTSVDTDAQASVESAARQFCYHFSNGKPANTVIKWDVVTSVRRVKTEEIPNLMKKVVYEKFFRFGVAFDESFQVAVIEEIMNAYQIYDYKNKCISLERLNKHLRNYKQKELDVLPEYVYLFETKAFACDAKEVIHELYGGAIKNKGRRVLASVDRNSTLNVVKTATEYLLSQIKEDGSFIYGYYPSFDNQMKQYNILRHCGTAWSMLCADDILEDGRIQAAVLKTLKNLKDVFIDQKDTDTAYVVERKADEIKLGGNGIAVITMAKYMDKYSDVDFTEDIRKLANGILTMQNPETGRYTHVLNSGDYSVKEEMRTVYYDGESTYALCQAYEVTRDNRYLEAAKKALDYQIENNYLQYRDHWLAYAFNNYIKHDTSEKYVDYALHNAWDNLTIIKNQPTSYHTYEELLTMTMDTYLFCKKQGFHSEYMDSLDLKALVDVIRYRAWHMLDGYWYPEYAMYMANPKSVLGSFFVRHDGYRSRIDDNQHFIDGYVKYYKLYDELQL